MAACAPATLPADRCAGPNAAPAAAPLRAALSDRSRAEPTAAAPSLPSRLRPIPGRSSRTRRGPAAPGRAAPGGTAGRFSGPAAPAIDPKPIYMATIVTDKGNIVAELYQDTPEGVNNFVTLAQNGYYDGLTFHRVEPGFVIQGGDPAGDGTAAPATPSRPRSTTTTHGRAGLGAHRRRGQPGAALQRQPVLHHPGRDAVPGRRTTRCSVT